MNILFLFLIGLSYLNPISISPWFNASQDLTVILAIIILSLNNINNKNLSLDRNVLFFILIVMFIPIFQKIIDIFYFNQDFILSLLYLSVFFLSFINGVYFDKLKNLCVMFIIVGYLSFFIQFIQWLDCCSSIFYMRVDYLRPSANIGQPNNLASLLYISLFSNLYLYLNKNINNYLYFFSWIIFLLGIVLTQSRTSWVAFFLIFLLVGLKRNTNILNELKKYLFVFLFFIFSIPVLNKYYHSSGLSVIERINSDYSRLDIWKQIIYAIQQQPWLGYGWNQTSIAQTQVSLTHPISLWIEYSHNLFLDIIIWMGIPIGFGLIIIISLWFLKVFFRIKSTNDLIVYSMVCTFFIHCMFEFPFAYAYFLVPIGLYVGILTGNLFDNKSVNINFFYLLLIFFISFLTYLLVKDYIDLNKRREEDAYNFFLGRPVTIRDDLKILDLLDLNNDVNYSDQCNIVLKKNLKDVEQLFLRYPTKKNIAVYYRTSLYYNDNIASKYMAWKYPKFKKYSNNCIR